MMLIPKASLSSDWSLQLDSMKLDSLVVFPGFAHKLAVVLGHSLERGFVVAQSMLAYKWKLPL